MLSIKVVAVFWQENVYAGKGLDFMGICVSGPVVVTPNLVAPCFLQRLSVLMYNYKRMCESNDPKLTANL